MIPHWSTRLILASAMLCSMSALAQARSNPQPKPSGIVVHLFGPDSIMSNITPDLPGENAATAGPGWGAPGAPPSGGQPGAPQPGAPQPGPLQQGTSPASAAQADNTSEPSLGAVLHQMFVVGDPNHPNIPSVGRAADRPPGN